MKLFLEKYQKYLEMAEKELRGKSLDSLTWSTPEGIEVKPFYSAKDLEDLGYLVFKTVEGLIMILVGILYYAGTIDSDTHTWFYDDIHVYFFGIAYLILSYLLYQIILVPRFISIWGVIGSIIFLIGYLLVVIGLFDVAPPIALLPVVLNELFLAIWLIAKGFNSDAVIAGTSKINAGNT